VRAKSLLLANFRLCLTTRHAERWRNLYLLLCNWGVGIGDIRSDQFLPRSTQIKRRLIELKQIIDSAGHLESLPNTY